MMCLLELLKEISVLLGPLSLDECVLSVPPLDLFFHALLPLLGKESLLVDLVLNLLLAVGDDLIDFDHHDLEHVVDDQRGYHVALVTAGDTHEFLDHLENFKKEASQRLEVDLQGFFLADNDVTCCDLVSQELL